MGLQPPWSVSSSICWCSPTSSKNWRRQADGGKGTTPTSFTAATVREPGVGASTGWLERRWTPLRSPQPAQRAQHGVLRERVRIGAPLVQRRDCTIIAQDAQRLGGSGADLALAISE